MPPRPAHLPNTDRGMVFSLLKPYYPHSSNKIDYSNKVNRLINDLLARVCNNNKVFEIVE